MYYCFLSFSHFCNCTFAFEIFYVEFSFLRKFWQASMACEEEKDSLMKEKYLVISFDPETKTIFSKHTSDLSNVDQNDYIHSKQASYNAQPVTITSTRQRTLKKSPMNKSSWIQLCRRYFVLDKQQLSQMVIKQKHKIKIADGSSLTIIRRDEKWYHTYIKMEGEVIYNTKWKLEIVDGYFFVAWNDIWIENGQRKESQIEIVTGTDFNFEVAQCNNYQQL